MRLTTKKRRGQEETKETLFKASPQKKRLNYDNWIGLSVGLYQLQRIRQMAVEGLVDKTKTMASFLSFTSPYRLGGLSRLGKTQEDQIQGHILNRQEIDGRAANLIQAM